MKSVISLSLLAALFFTACSQEHKEDVESKAVAVKTKVQKESDKDKSLACLDAEGKITCRLSTRRVGHEREVKFEWRSPDGEDDRERGILLPANHASIYDARFKAGRAKGLWHVEVELDGEEVKTSFVID